MGKAKWSTDEKKLVVLELLRGAKTVGQLAKERGMSEALIYRWRDQAIKEISDTFSEKRQRNGANFTAEKERYLKVIGEQTCVIETLKKISEML
jgi:transposase-like protein